MIMRTWSLLLTLSVLSTSTAGAQGVSCDSSASTRAMQSCLANELEAAGDSLASVEVSFRARTSGASDQDWRDLRATWIAYRDKECALRGAMFSGGSLLTVAVAECRVELTRARVQQLRRVLSNMPDGR